jgi:hypothetical protein
MSGKSMGKSNFNGGSLPDHHQDSRTSILSFKELFNLLGRKKMMKTCRGNLL